MRYTLRISLKSNMKQKTIRIGFTVILFAFIFYGSRQYIKQLPSIKGITTNISSAEIIALTNLVRLNQDIPTLRPNNTLEEAAEKKAKDMIEKGYFDHVDSEGSGPWKFIDQDNYIYHYAGENLARNFSTSEEVVDAWYGSQEHKNNMLNPLFNDIGVAVIEDQDQVYIVQLLASQVPKDLMDQLENYQKDFIFTTPITGSRRKINSNIALTLFSIFITSTSFIIAIVVAKLIKNQPKSFKSPEMSHWKKK